MLARALLRAPHCGAQERRSRETPLHQAPSRRIVLLFAARGMWLEGYILR